MKISKAPAPCHCQRLQVTKHRLTSKKLPRSRQAKSWNCFQTTAQDTSDDCSLSMTTVLKKSFQSCLKVRSEIADLLIEQFLSEYLIFSGKIDSSLKDCDENEPYIPPDEVDPVFVATGLERSNIYNGDKFDVMKNDEFAGEVKKNGKFITKREPKTYHELLNDKSHVRNTKERYQGYGLVTEADDADYDDEYDDSYDVFADTEPKVKVRFHDRMRDMLPDTLDLPETESEDEEETVPSSAGAKPGLDFCENPEVIRARREQQYQNRMAKKHPNRQQQPKAEPKTFDVVGGQKGQGQSNEVLRNRQMKGANKSSRANHNRKSGSTFKQSRGMF